MSGVQHEWKRGADFAEWAEAIGIETRDVLAAWDTGNAVMVLHTNEYAALTDPVLQSRLVRDADGIYRAGPPVETEFTVVDLFKDRR